MRKITLFTAILLLIVGANTSSYSQPSYPTKPGESQLIITDLENFASTLADRIELEAND